MIESINYIRSDVSLGRSKSKILNSMHSIESHRAKSSVRISSGKRIENGFEDIFASIYTKKLSTSKDFHDAIYKNAFYSRGVTEMMDQSLTNLIDLTSSLYNTVTEARNNFYSNDDRHIINNTFQSFKEDFMNKVSSSEFLGKKLLVGSYYNKENSFSVFGKEGIAKGIQRVVLDNDHIENSNIKIEYDAENYDLIIKDLKTNDIEIVNISENVIENGKIQNIRFKKFNLNVFLDSNFDKSQSIGLGYSDINDPENPNNAFINESAEVFSDYLIDSDGDGVLDSVEKLFELSNVKVTNVDGDISDVSDLDILFDEDFRFDTKEMKFKIKTSDGNDFTSDNYISLDDLKENKNIKLHFSRNADNWSVQKKDSIDVSFDVALNKLPINHVFLKGESFIKMNELKNVSAFGVKIEKNVKFEFKTGVGENDNLKLEFESLDYKNLNIGEDLHLLDEESTEKAFHIVFDLFNKLNAMRSNVADSQNILEKAFDSIKNTSDVMGMEISSLEDTDIPIELALMMQFENAAAASVEILNKEFKAREILLKILQ